MENIISQAHKRLLKNKQTIAIAESCTGGLLSSFLTKLPGSSSYFILGVVTYSNKAKQNILRIPATIIRKNGAVSKTISILMSQKVKQLAKANLSIAITGIAGPSGATSNKPVGTVFISITKGNKTLCKKFLFKGNRNAIRKKAALKAIALLNKLS